MNSESKISSGDFVLTNSYTGVYKYQTALVIGREPREHRPQEELIKILSTNQGNFALIYRSELDCELFVCSEEQLLKLSQKRSF